MTFISWIAAMTASSIVKSLDLEKHLTRQTYVDVRAWRA